jgi:hypothetical protein
VTLAADPKATNSIDAALEVAPVTSTLSDVRPGFTYKVPAHGIVVLTLERAERHVGGTVAPAARGMDHRRCPPAVAAVVRRRSR